MKKTLLIITFLLSIKFYSQEIIEFNKGEFSFYLTKDCKIGECKISKIIVFKNGEFIQEIIPSENDFSSFINNKSIMEIEDMNFDNYIDFRIIKSIPAEYPFPYLYWIYNEKAKLFEINTDYEKIISPTFDYEKKIIISNWCGYLRDCYEDCYKLIEGKLNFFERHFTKPNRNGTRQVETWKVIDGELKLITSEEK
jgi:hypothetical protein